MEFLPQWSTTLGFLATVSRDINEGTSAQEHAHGYTLYDYTVNYELEEPVRSRSASRT